MSTLSIRIDPDLERRLDLEVARLGTTRSRFVQDLLSEKLEQRSPLHLLEEARAEYGLPDPAKARKRTNKAAQVKRMVQDAVAAKHGRSPRKTGP
jgi:metal-responsive CopG/Arc/MetJ family transcriptional regulator